MTLKHLVRRIVPNRLWNVARLHWHRRRLRHFRPYIVEHRFGESRFCVWISDPLARGWYDRDWNEPADIKHLRRFGLRPGARVFDLGAHQGVVALMLAQIVGPTGSVFAVEANHHNVIAAEKNRQLNRVDWLTIAHAAVASESGDIIFNEGLNGQVDDGRGEWGRVRVGAVTIDQLALRYGHPDVLLIDVEGYECQALAGAHATMRSWPDALVEVHVGAGLEKFGGSAKDVVGFFPTEIYDLAIATENASTMTPLRIGDRLPNERFFLTAVKRLQHELS